ncbi:3-dehydroquinate synthase [Desulfobacterota bacterium M19]
MKSLRVGLGDRAYDILIAQNILVDIGRYLKEAGFARRYFVVADSNVAEIYGDDMLASLRAAGYSPQLLTFPAGEESKNLALMGQLASRLARLGMDRSDALLALGGGVTGDLTGFLAASYMRGVSFVQVPTSLLAQVDSSVGGKTGVDIPEGKNLIGAFYQPRAVFIDSAVLKTLPAPELLNGLAEVIKYGVIYDRDFFDFLEERRLDILNLERSAIEKLVESCCAVKAAVVEADEREADLRRILNFGHTIGHAVEADSDFKLAHGSAVAIGMAAVCRLAVLRGGFAAAEAERVIRLISDFGLPVSVPAAAEVKRLKGYLLSDKKTVGGRVFFVLPTTIGKVEISADIDAAHLDQVLRS